MFRAGTVGVAIGALLLALPAGAARIEGVEFAERLEAGGTALELRGYGVLRYRVFFKGYAAALYLAEGVEPERMLEDVPRSLEIEYFWSIPAKAFQRATLDGIARNVDARTLDSLRERIERFNQLYIDVQPGDRYALTYVPGVGTELALNGVTRGSIAGADFAAALFAIWFGEAPFDAGLKADLMGQS
ncbi:MAG: chalcone isomerase family protein [Myxococcales bacterium]|nr:chalcone isomerase family protein [Myxococcales bacterium]MDH5308124.1 chalcone isomerase family protein [Myxococcales bacterium]MDH5566594.1 chalcone isomerase family protein [Myxococcales bacterium]